MINKSFFEYLAIADVERIHSQIIAWIFSEDCHAIDINEKSNLLNSLFGVSITGQIKVITESRNIDILIETETDVIVIENKIKSSIHSNQLNKYWQNCESKHEHKKRHYYLLSLGELSNDKNWKDIKYSTLCHALKFLQLEETHPHSTILREYILFLQRLIQVVDDFLANPAKYPNVFTDGAKTKHQKIAISYDADQRFIAQNQLETILQKCFLAELTKDITNCEIQISETHGTALVDFMLNSCISYNGHQFCTMIQVQGTTVKFVFTIERGKYASSDKAMLHEAIEIMHLLHGEKQYGYKAVNRPTARAYVSLSKKLNTEYWKLDPFAFKNLIAGYLEEGHALSRNLVKKLAERVTSVISQ